MKPLKNVDSANLALILRNTIWAFPYLAVMGLMWGYLAGGSSGAVAGLAVAFLVSAAIGPAASNLTGRLGEGAVNTLFGLNRRTIGSRERMAGDLNVVRYHKLCNRFKDECLLKIIKVEPDKKAVFRRWALSFYGEMSEEKCQNNLS
jgi:hypothetical protein